MNFKNLYRKFYTVRLSLLLITFLMTIALLILSLNFWLEVESTRKYSKQAIDNSILQEKINNLYNFLSLEKINIQYALSITSKSINIPSKDRKEINTLNDDALLAFNQLLSELKKYDLKNFNQKELNKLNSLWSEYQTIKKDVNKVTKRVSTIMNPRRGTTSSTTRVIKKNREENPAYILLNKWSEISNKICMQLIIMSEKLTFRPERLVRSIEDLQNFRSSLLRYNEYIHRDKALLSGVIAIDFPISKEEFNIFSKYQSIEREIKLSLEKRLERALEINSGSEKIEQAFYKNFKEKDYFNNNFNTVKNDLINQGVGWEKYSLNIKDFLELIKNNKEKNQEIIISLSNAISLLSSNLYEKSIKNQIFASIILFMTILLAAFSFLIVSFSIARPLENITSVMKKLSKGEKTSNVPEIDRAGEIGIMASAVANFKEQADNYAKQLEITVNERTKELKEVNNLLTSSIDYASKIQKAFLPDKIELKDFCNDFFIYHSQRDVVGGDFYSIFKIDNKVYISVFDCAGHGVPGALLTMILGSFLQKITKEQIKSPAEILTNLNIFFKEALKNTEGYEVSEDGLDAAVLEIQENNLNFRYASAGMPLIIIKDDTSKLIKGDKKGIGYSSTPSNFKFNNFDLKVLKNDLIYLASDGICDQIGGKGISFGNKRFIEALEKGKKLNMIEQKNKFVEIFKNYRGSYNRRDDITLIGIKA